MNHADPKASHYWTWSRTQVSVVFPIRSSTRCDYNKDLSQRQTTGRACATITRCTTSKDYASVAYLIRWLPRAGPQILGLDFEGHFISTNVDTRQQSCRICCRVSSSLIAIRKSRRVGEPGIAFEVSSRKSRWDSRLVEGLTLLNVTR